MMSDDEFYKIYFQYCELVERLESKILVHLEKNPKADLTEQEGFIRKLLNLRGYFHKLYHINLTLTRGQVEVMIEREKLLNKIKRLETENTNLKNNIL